MPASTSSPGPVASTLRRPTLSQLGLVFAALGVGAWTAAIFHLMTHGFFKGLLFLGSGSVIHTLHEEQDMRRMGGLARRIPATYATMLVGALWRIRQGLSRARLSGWRDPRTRVPPASADPGRGIDARPKQHPGETLFGCCQAWPSGAPRGDCRVGPVVLDTCPSQLIRTRRPRVHGQQSEWPQHMLGPLPECAMSH